MRRDDHLIDLEEVNALAQEYKPTIIVAGGSAYPRVIDFEAFEQIADSVGAYFMVDMAHFAGLVAGGVYPSRCPLRMWLQRRPQNIEGTKGRHDPQQRP